MQDQFFQVFFTFFIPDANVSLFAVAGMAAVTGSVIGGPISIMIIIFELTSDYQVALGAGISICFANLVFGDSQPGIQPGSHQKGLPCPVS